MASCGCISREFPLNIKRASFGTSITSTVATPRPRATPAMGAIAKQIVDMHGGRIWVESFLGKGSTFQMQLPTRLQFWSPPHDVAHSKSLRNQSADNKRWVAGY